MHIAPLLYTASDLMGTAKIVHVFYVKLKKNYVGVLGLGFCEYKELLNKGHCTCVSYYACMYWTILFLIL